MKKPLLAISLAALLGGLPKPALAQIVQVDGSSTVFPITEAVAEEFQKAKKGKVKVTVGIAGTAFDALTVIVNPKNDWASPMTVAELKKIWEPAAQGKITNWNQVREKWPNAPLKLFGAGADSGTFDYFTEAITGKAKSSRGDFTASEDDNVLVQGVANDRNALGFFGFAYYAENTSKLKAVAIDNGKGAVGPSEKTVLDGSYQPLSRPIYIYVSKKAAEKPEVREFVEFYLKNAPNLIKQVKYVPLPEKLYTLGASRFKGGKVGTAFAGHADVGVTIEDLMKREPKL
jgi:phosphate transport system substrate-binding protein